MAGKKPHTQLAAEQLDKTLMHEGDGISSCFSTIKRAVIAPLCCRRQLITESPSKPIHKTWVLTVFDQNLVSSDEIKAQKRSGSSLPEQAGKRQRRRHTMPMPEAIDNPLVEETNEPVPVNDSSGPIAHWISEGKWPPRYAESNISRIVIGRSYTASVSHDSPGSASSTTQADQKLRERKSTPYAKSKYEPLLQNHGTFMHPGRAKPTEDARRMCKELLVASNPVPIGTLFDEEVHSTACCNLAGKNEARVIRDVSNLIVPSAELANLRDSTLMLMHETVNARWNTAIPLIQPSPKPDYAVGFGFHSFNHAQMDKLKLLLGDFLNGRLTYYMGTYSLYFPFLTCEVKCGAAAFEIADRQNAHSMTLAVRGVVELFRTVKREGELSGEVLAFSVSHTDRHVRIDGWFPVIEGTKISCYRYPVHTSTFASPDERERWSTYHFTMNLYKTWVPKHFQRICSVLDQLPANVDLNVPRLSQSRKSAPWCGQLPTCISAYCRCFGRQQ